MSSVSDLPTPALRWVGSAGRIALRAFDFASDSQAVCSFQRETYGQNFPDFRWSESFAAAFRHDLRRAALDGHHGLFVLDSGRQAGEAHLPQRIGGFLWLVVCQNSWTRDRYGYINNIYIAPALRKQGLARALMQQGDIWFRAKGVRRVRLTVTASNDAARHLYEECGFVLTRYEMDKEI
jgi:ribosomal protein S18 acetylase RimI-like enzyme